MKTAKIKLTKRNKSIANKGILFCIIALAFPVAHFLFMFFLQNGGTFVLSFQEFSIKSGNFEFIGWKNFTTIFRILGSEYSEFPLALRNSFIFFLLNNFFILPISICCAIVCYKRIPLSNVFRVILFLPTVISPVVLAMVYRFAWDSTVGFIPELLEQLHLTNLIPVLGFLADKQTAMPLLLFYCVWIGLGGSIILLTGAIAKIPDHLIELDRLYGLSFIKEVWYVILPLIGPTVSILFLQGAGRHTRILYAGIAYYGRSRRYDDVCVLYDSAYKRRAVQLRLYGGAQLSEYAYHVPDHFDLSVFHR